MTKERNFIFFFFCPIEKRRKEIIFYCVFSPEGNPFQVTFFRTIMSLGSPSSKRKNEEFSSAKTDTNSPILSSTPTQALLSKSDSSYSYCMHTVLNRHLGVLVKNWKLMVFPPIQQLLKKEI